MKTHDNTMLTYIDTYTGTRPVIRLVHEVDFEGDEFIFFEHKAADFIRLTDALYPEIVDAGGQREGKFFAIFDRESRFMGSLTGQPVGRSGAYCMGSFRKNPFYKSDDRYAFLRACLAIQARGGADVFRSWTRQDNYGMQSMWHVLGVGAKPVKNSRRLQSVGGSAESIAELEGFMARGKGIYGDYRAAAARRLDKIGEKAARAAIPQIENMPHTAFTASVSL